MDQHARMIGRRQPGILATLALSVAAAGCLTPVTNDAPGASASAGSPATPSASAPPTFVRPTPNPSPTFLVHEVRAGESLTSIARLYGTTARSIAYWNRDQYPSVDPDSVDYEPDRIEVGWVLRLIPTEVVDEDELPDPTPTVAPASASPSPDTTTGASNGPG